MGKNIVFPYVTFNKFVDEPIIKKLSLFYDHIYIGNGRFNIIDSVSKKNVKDEDLSLLYENAVWNFLKDNNVVKTYPYLNEKFKDLNQEAIEVSAQLTSLFEKEKSKKEWPSNPNEDELLEMKKEYFTHILLTHDLSIRLDTIQLRKIDELSEYYPLLRTSGTLKGEDKKSQVIQFLLDDIPVPDNSVSWDQIIEYRTDEDVRNKYLALINWVNKASNSNLKLSELKDEYNYLYSEYIKQFELHKMKFNNSTLEIVLNSTLNFLTNIGTGNYISSVKDLFQFKIKNATLLQEETKLPGKEIAYIFHTKTKFENKS